MNHRLDLIPFSHRGSWMSFYRRNPSGHGGLSTAPLSLRVLAGRLWEESEHFAFELEQAGQPVLWRASHDFSCLRLVAVEEAPYAQSENAEAVMVFQDAETVRLRVSGATLRLDFSPGVPAAVRVGPGVWRVRTASCGFVLLSAINGELVWGTHAQRPSLRLRGEGGPAELIIHRTTSGTVPPRPQGSIDDCVTRVRAELGVWLDAFGNRGGARLPSVLIREVSTLWILSVKPLGNFGREAVLVSKGTLVGLWSWDHCWHMLGVAPADPVLAWNCFMAVFDHQEAGGALPDVLCANQAYWGCLKPPVHGWILSLLEKRHAWFTDAHRRQVYEPMARLTRFWLREYDDDQDGVLNYLHGNDSGWDNSTAFDDGVPLETPDLSTWLILQMDWLADASRRLGLVTEAEEWSRAAEELLARMLVHFWTGERFVARLSGSHAEVRSESLLLRIPLLLGDRIPEAARRWCLDGLDKPDRYLSACGLRSEPANSAKFRADGYWRGAVWPVVAFIFSEALRANGKNERARDLEDRYIRHVADTGNFENYRGDNGTGLKDSAIAWTASCISWFMTRSREG